jgi:hypothetical protein
MTEMYYYDTGSEVRRMKMRMARRISNGEHFLETPAVHWDLFLEAWRCDHTHPAPMIEGHRMFRHPQEYGVRVFEVDTNDLLKAVKSA